jgi:hypothetical protein
MSEYIEFVRQGTGEEKETIIFTAMDKGLVVEITTLCDDLRDSYALVLEPHEALTLREFLDRNYGGK